MPGPGASAHPCADSEQRAGLDELATAARYRHCQRHRKQWSRWPS